MAYEYARKATLLMIKSKAIPVHRAHACELAYPAPEGRPRRATILRNGSARKVYGQIFMQKWYIFAWSTRRRTVGMKRTCTSAAMAPAVASANPIWAVCAS